MFYDEVMARFGEALDAEVGSPVRESVARILAQAANARAEEDAQGAFEAVEVATDFHA